MHQPIREHLETYLAGIEGLESTREVEDHLNSCEQCRKTLSAMRRQAEAIQTLRPSAEMDPQPGFYARVLDRIESQRVPSVWELFLEPAFGRRLAYASLTLILILGTLMFTGEDQRAAGTGFYYTSPEAILAAEPVSQYIGDDIDYDRGVVFVNLATYEN